MSSFQELLRRDVHPTRSVLTTLAMLLLVALGAALVVSAKPVDELNEGDAQYWLNEGRTVLEMKLAQIEKFYGDSDYSRKRAKNLILFIGDGMGLTTVTAARIYKGQKHGSHLSERQSLSWESMPYTALAKVFTTDTQVSDSAASATSYHNGVKTRKGVIGLSGKVPRADCPASLDPTTRLESMFKWAQDEGKVTGLVTTTRVTHASPAPLYSSSADRDWESHAPEGCLDIAQQLVRSKVGQNIRVVLGGGRGSFLPRNESEICKNNAVLKECEGRRQDKTNLIEEWIHGKKAKSGQVSYVDSRDDLMKVDTEGTEYLMGLFSGTHMPFVLDMKSPTEVPSLAEMTEKALKVLEANSEHGYVLFVEGGRIDMAHHFNQAQKALEETYQFDKAVEVALNITDPEDTLILVTADHSHALTINGYPKRGNDILGIAGYAADDLPYTTLLYGNGAGALGGRKNITVAVTTNKDYINGAAVPFKDNQARHGGEDVPVYARGPGAHLFTGVFDQVFVAHGMAHAACLGPHRDLCPDDHPRQVSEASSSSKFASVHVRWTLITVFVVLAMVTVGCFAKRYGYQSFR